MATPQTRSPEGRRVWSESHGFLGAVTALLAIAAVAFDLYLPLAVASGMLYLVVVLLGLLWQRQSYTAIAAAAGTVITVADYFLHRPYETIGAAIANRTLLICMLWVTAFVVLRQKRTERRLQDTIVDLRRADDALRGSETRLRSIVDTAVDAILVIDTRGIIESFNPAAERLFGYAAAEVAGRNISTLMPPPYASEHNQYISRYLATGERRIIGIGREVEAQRKDGSTFPIHLSVSEMRIDGAVKFTGIINDISDRKRAEERVLQLAAIVESSDDAIIGKGPDGRVLTWNAGAERIYGYGAEEAKGRPVSFLVPPDRLAELADMDAKIARGESIEHFETVRLRKDGRPIFVSLTLSPMRDSAGRITGASGIARDITAQKQAEERQREQAALARVGAMATVVAHEVKNPLTGLRGALQVIGGHLPAGSADAAIIGEMVARIDSLNLMVQDLLLYARPRTPRFAVVPVAALIRETVALLAKDPALRNVRVEVTGEDPVLTADADLLRAVFQNLLLNAGQAMQGRGRIAVSIATTDGRCEIAVADEGPGIAPAAREKIFEPFFTTKHRGAGLGLPIAKRAMELHGGDIAIECPEGGGTTVRLRLPLGARAAS